VTLLAADPGWRHLPDPEVHRVTSSYRDRTGMALPSCRNLGRDFGEPSRVSRTSEILRYARVNKSLLRRR